ncbi:hypothetical protein ACFLQN_02840 [Candidatus Aenigmatarchaeota archaeon]
MKTINYLAIAGIILVLLMSPVHAAGIKWFTESETIIEGETKCVTYGVYNPFGHDVISSVSLSGEIVQIATVNEQEFEVKGGTMNFQAIPVEVCFAASSEMYEEHCLLGPIACEKTCTQDRIALQGDIVVTDRMAQDKQTSGSKTTISASAPLEIAIGCVPHELDTLPVYFIIITVVLVILIGMVFRKKRTPVDIRKQRKIEKLERQLEKEKRSTTRR